MSSERPDATPDPDYPSHRRSLATRWGNWAANLFVSGLLIVAGLVFGREVLHWWYVEAPQLESGQGPTGIGRTNPSGGAAGESDETGAELQFGELPVVFRHGSLAGDFKAALAKMQQQCAETAQTASAIHSQRPPGAAEAKLIEELAATPAEAQVTGVGEMFVRERPVPMAVVLSGGQETAVRDRRVLAWGILFPSRGESADSQESESSEPAGWGWFTWRPTDVRAADGDGGLIRVPTLSGGRRTLAMRLESGELRVGYAGQASPARWREACDAWFSREGWTPVDERPWDEGDRTWVRHYWRPGGGQSAPKPGVAPGRGGAQNAEILIREEPSGQLQAFLIMSPTVAPQ